MRVLIIDDEPRARTLLEKMLLGLDAYTFEIQTAKNLLDGLEILKQQSIDLLFLDIEMPQHSGLELFDILPPPYAFQIVFTTAYNQYAVEAFKKNAIDYLLKPIDLDELEIAVSKASTANKGAHLEAKLEDLAKALKKVAINKIALEVAKGILFVEHKDILYFEADGMYTNVFLRDGTKKCISKPLKNFVEQLEQDTLFFKCHRSFLVNLQYVKEFSRKDGDQLIMENGKSVPISKSNKESFLKLIQQVYQ
ncbi:LytR/AlgR family response regulator transcription factor [uncultured Mesonia sp.]|uniref:LytR/AlgR family response regulator transcription factor n=1 Tax=uncultured Mesonia sp. TaxID=399731 RepID=UPI00374F4FB3